MKRTVLSTITLAILAIAIAVAVASDVTAPADTAVTGPRSAAVGSEHDSRRNLSRSNSAAVRSTPLQRRPGRARAGIALCVCQPPLQRHLDGSFRRTLQPPCGVWLVEITPRNCATGEPIPTAVTKALYTFHDDGTMSRLISKQLTYARAYRRLMDCGGGTSVGTCLRSSSCIIRRNVSTSEPLPGQQEGAGALVLADSGDEFTTDGSDAPAWRCSNSVGTRFKLERIGRHPSTHRTGYVATSWRHRGFCVHRSQRWVRGQRVARPQSAA